MIPKPLMSIMLSDLQSLCDASAPETTTMEFKEQLYLLELEKAEGKRRQVEELCKDVSSLANSRGGDIIFGIAEDSDGKAESVKSIPSIPHDDLQRQINTLLRANIDPPISITLHSIPVTDETVTIVLRVDQSTNAPHRVKYRDDKSVFWRRVGASCVQMDTREIHESFKANDMLSDRIKNFVHNRVNGVTTSSELCPIDGEGAIFVHLIPFDAFSSTVRLQREAIMEEFSSFTPTVGGAGRWRKNVDGVCRQSSGSETHFRIQIYTNGIVEIALGGVLAQNNSEKYLHPKTCMDILEMLVSCVSRMRNLGLSSRIWFFFSLREMMGQVFNTFNHYEYDGKFDRSTLFLPEVDVSDLCVDSFPAVARLVFDELCSAAGYSTSLRVDDDGKLHFR